MEDLLNDHKKVKEPTITDFAYQKESSSIFWECGRKFAERLRHIIFISRILANKCEQCRVWTLNNITLSKFLTDKFVSPKTKAQRHLNIHSCQQSSINSVNRICTANWHNSRFLLQACHYNFDVMCFSISSAKELEKLDILCVFVAVVKDESKYGNISSVYSLFSNCCALVFRYAWKLQ